MKAPAITAVAAALVSDATSLQVLGLTGRQFRAFVREHGVPHFKSGRRTLARLDRVLEVADRLSGEPAAASNWSEADLVRRMGAQ